VKNFLCALAYFNAKPALAMPPPSHRETNEATHHARATEHFQRQARPEFEVNKYRQKVPQTFLY